MTILPLPITCLLCFLASTEMHLPHVSVPGYYCDLSLGLANVSVVRPCPKGHYCPAGTSFSTQNPCPIGSYNPRERTDSPAGCLPCPPGQYCPTVGLAKPAGKTEDYTLFYSILFYSILKYPALFFSVSVLFRFLCFVLIFCKQSKESSLEVLEN